MTTPSGSRASVRSSAPEMPSPAAAVSALVACLESVPAEHVDFADAVGRVLGQALVCDRPSPAADVSAMDGYAVRRIDLRRDGALDVCGEVRIGSEPRPLPPGKTLRIVTGAGIPAGADTVIRREDVEELPDRIVIRAPPPARGENIRCCGENAGRGHEVVPAGTLVTPAVAAALATFGCARPVVRRRVRLGVIVTGDELKRVDDELTPWLLRDSNGPALASMFGDAAWLGCESAQHVADDPEVLKRAVRARLDTCDALVLTGGASIGTRDFVRDVLRALDAEIVFHGVRQRPGKPVLGAYGPEGQAILGLPGNPVAVLVTGRRIVAPVLGHLAGVAGHSPLMTVAVEAPSNESLDVWWHRPIRLTTPGWGRLVSTQGSGDIVSAAAADGFVEIPPGETGCGPWPYYPWTL